MEYCASALLDLRLHQKEAVEAGFDLAAFERDGLAAIGLPKEVVMRWRFGNFNRPFKKAGAGAWMSSLRTQHYRGGERVAPIILNNSNFAKGADGAPTLLSFDDVRTLFHEFGHALHGLLSDVPFRNLAGTAVLRDFVELPSQARRPRVW